MCALIIWLEVHAVDVIGADHDDEMSGFIAQEVEALQDGVGGSRANHRLPRRCWRALMPHTRP
jgi:hypothetical protein